MMLGQENQDCMGQPCISVLPLGEGVYQAIAGHCSQSIPRGGYDGGSLYSLLTVGGLHPTAAHPIRVRNRLSAKIAGDEQLQLSISTALHGPWIMEKHNETFSVYENPNQLDARGAK